MGHNDDGYAAMLLTLALSPDKEEYTRPFGIQEFRRFEAAARASSYRGIGALLEVDISGMMMYMGITEEEGYRAFTLLHRGMQLTYMLEGYALKGIQTVTQYDGEYPRRLERKLGEAAPPFLYWSGNLSVLDMPAIAVIGISGVRTTPEARADIEALVRSACASGYAVITGGELGVSHVAAGLVERYGGCLVDIVGGGMLEHIADETIARLIGEGRAIVLSTEHPEALFTVNHAIARNRLLFAMTDAAFIFNTDGRRGEADALQSRACDWIYAWEGYPGNGALIARGAVPFGNLSDAQLEQISRHWSSSRAQQLNIFDMLAEARDAP